MKKVSELKKGDAIRVGESDYLKLAELLDKEGYTWSHGAPMTGYIPWRDKKDLYKYNGDILLTFSGSKFVRFNTHMTNPEGENRWENASDFLRPEPRFRKGDLVKYKGPSKEIFRIGEIVWEGDHYRYLPENSKVGYSETAIDFAPAQAYTEPKFKVGDRVIVSDHPLIKEAVIKAVKQHPDTGNWAYVVSDGTTGSYISEHLLSQQQFEIGKSYSFTDRDGIEWQGKLLAVVDHKYKYIALIDGSDIPAAFDQIKPLQPKEITKEDLASLLSDWIELYDKDFLKIDRSYYQQTIGNLYMNSKSILDQLKQK